MPRVLVGAVLGSALTLGVLAILLHDGLAAPSHADHLEAKAGAEMRMEVVGEAAELCLDPGNGLELRSAERKTTWESVSRGFFGEPSPFLIQFGNLLIEARLRFTDDGASVRDLMSRALALTGLYDEHLARAGLRPVSSHWWGDPAQQRDDALDVYVTGGSRIHSDGVAGAMSSTVQYDFVLEEATHIRGWRMYLSVESGAALFLRLEIRRAERELDVDFFYSDRTVCGVPYPGGKIEFGERLVMRE